MTSTQYRVALSKLKLSQGEAAKIVGVALPTSQRWAAGTSRVSEPAAKLLRLIISEKLSIDDVRKA